MRGQGIKPCEDGRYTAKNMLRVRDAKICYGNRKLSNCQDIQHAYFDPRGGLATLTTVAVVYTAHPRTKPQSSHAYKTTQLICKQSHTAHPHTKAQNLTCKENHTAHMQTKSHSLPAYEVPMPICKQSHTPHLHRNTKTPVLTLFRTPSVNVEMTSASTTE
jgi:hypothetical protein